MIFLWDFTRTYYAIPAFFTTAISKGIFPQWMPFQAMGYPLLVNSQSGLFYPIFWIFPLFGIPYTLYSAVILQCLHIFFGSLGMFLFLKLVFKSTRLGFIGAVAFQFFGGFYSASEFPDIIRGYSIIPWLFYLLTIDFKSNLTLRVLFLPLGMYFFITSSYPGIFIASIFIFGMYVTLQILNAWLKGIPKIRILKISSLITFLTILGFSMGAVFLGPIWQERNEITRFGSTVQYNELWFNDLHSIFLSNRTIPGITVLSSAFITLPIFAFACFLSYATIKKYWIIFTILVISVLMIAGQQSFFWNSVTNLLPFLKLSRFPMFDYLGFISIPLLLFGIAGLKTIFKYKESKRRFIFRSCFLIASVSIALLTLYSTDLNIQEITTIILTGITVLIIGYLPKRLGNASNLVKVTTIPFVTMVIIISIISVDGFVVTSDMPRWNQQTPVHYWTYMIPPEKNGILTTTGIFDNLPQERPARESVYNNLINSWKGYLDGTFMMGDYGGTVLESRTLVESNDIYKKYMQMRWTPIFLDPSVIKNNNEINLPKSDFEINETQSQRNVNQTLYGINEITYRVSLKEPQVMVENEMYFPGWHAVLSFTNRQVSLNSIPVNGIFRGWILPSGEYEMKTYFEFPNFEIYECITFVSIGLWFILIIHHMKNRNRKEVITT